MSLRQEMDRAQSSRWPVTIDRLAILQLSWRRKLPFNYSEIRLLGLLQPPTHEETLREKSGK